MKYASLAVTLLSTAALHIGAARAQSSEEVVLPASATLPTDARVIRVAHTEKLMLVESEDARGTRSLAAFDAPPTPAAKADGLPIYGATPAALPELQATRWGLYRPSNRPSQQIEHRMRIISAGYLR